MPEQPEDHSLIVRSDKRLALLTNALAARSLAAVEAAADILQFPEEYSLGDLGGSQRWNGDFTSIGEARGKVSRAGYKFVRLTITAVAAERGPTALRAIPSRGIEGIDLLATGILQVDELLVHLDHLTNLMDFELMSTQVTDAGLAHLGHLTNLRYLGLMGTQVTDAGLVHLSRLTNLTKLDLWNTLVTDAGLAHLSHLTNLEGFIFKGT